MSAQHQLESWTEQEYWDLEKKSSIRHEFIKASFTRWRLYTKRSEAMRFPKLQIELSLEEIYQELEMVKELG